MTTYDVIIAAINKSNLCARRTPAKQQVRNKVPVLVTTFVSQRALNQPFAASILLTLKCPR
jgi:hypothetical protein